MSADGVINSENPRELSHENSGSPFRKNTYLRAKEDYPLLDYEEKVI